MKTTDDRRRGLVFVLEDLVEKLDELESPICDIIARHQPRACWYNAEKNLRERERWRGGIFHGWSIENESQEITMPLPVAIVEDAERGDITTVMVHNVRFRPPEEHESQAEK